MKRAIVWAALFLSLGLGTFRDRLPILVQNRLRRMHFPVSLYSYVIGPIMGAAGVLSSARMVFTLSRHGGDAVMGRGYNVGEKRRRSSWWDSPWLEKWLSNGLRLAVRGIGGLTKNETSFTGVSWMLGVVWTFLLTWFRRFTVLMGVFQASHNRSTNQLACRLPFPRVLRDSSPKLRPFDGYGHMHGNLLTTAVEQWNTALEVGVRPDNTGGIAWQGEGGSMNDLTTMFG
ncbi:MAG: hypothetical protein QHI48_06180 [Bacteroidota bacterium]|nr:hypothetical protein [Bacteroidota bacterium]